MTRNVRNFWVEAEIDGQKTILKGGPKRKDGGMSITIYQRDNNGITKAIKINCLSFGDNTLETVVYDREGKATIIHQTNR